MTQAGSLLAKSFDFSNRHEEEIQLSQYALELNNNNIISFEHCKYLCSKTIKHLYSEMLLLRDPPHKINLFMVLCDL